jgi:hypothetical protein
MSDQKNTFVLKRMFYLKVAINRRPNLENPFERQVPRTSGDQRIAEQKTMDETILRTGSCAAVAVADFAGLEKKVTDGDVLIDGCLRIARELVRQGKEEAAADALAVARRTALQSSTDWMINRTWDVWNTAVELGYAMEMERDDAVEYAERLGKTPAPVEQERPRVPEEPKQSDKGVETAKPTEIGGSTTPEENLFVPDKPDKTPGQEWAEYFAGKPGSSTRRKKKRRWKGR